MTQIKNPDNEKAPTDREAAAFEAPVQTGPPIAVRLKRLHLFSTGVLTLGILGVFVNMLTAPAAFPVISMFMAAAGIILSVSVSTKFLTGAHHEK